MRGGDVQREGRFLWIVISRAKLLSATRNFCGSSTGVLTGRGPKEIKRRESRAESAGHPMGGKKREHNRDCQKGGKRNGERGWGRHESSGRRVQNSKGGESGGEKKESD